MVSFKFALALLLASVSDSSASPRPRRLSRELIAGYEPGSLVTDHNAIDLDQSLIQAQLATGTAQSFATAKDVYLNGAHSKSVATVTVSALTEPLIKKAPVTGKNAAGQNILGAIYDNYPIGTTEISFQYDTIGVQANYVGCQVGAHPAPFTDDCLVESGDLEIGSQTLAYTYDVATDNNNGRTIQGFSTAAEKKMYRCDNCPYEGYNKFYEYYGNFQYGDEWVMAAFDGRATNYAKGNADFSVYTEVGREQAIKKGTVFLNIFMYVIRELEDAIDDCKDECDGDDGCNDDPVHAWDEAVAFYTGSLEGIDGEGSGVLLHGLAESRCKNFKTCGGAADEITGNAHVNIEIFKEFTGGLRNLQEGNCFEVKDNIKRIESLMAVPMIQGVLRYAHISNFNSDAGEKAEAEGAIFAAAVLPYIHACDEDTAAVIYENMKTGGSADFVVVKEALESVYTCMDLVCSDVGGLHDVVTGGYLNDAAPCETSASTSKSTNAGLIAGLALFLLYTVM